MSGYLRTVTLGSGGLERTLRPALDSLGAGDEVALVAAGRQEFESDNGALARVSGRRLRELGLHRRTRALIEADPALGADLRARAAEAQALQRDYRVRLAHVTAAWREARQASPHARDALHALRALDRRHVQHLAHIADRPLPESGVLEEVRGRVAHDLGDMRTVLVAGGHVAVLRNRLRLLGLDALLADRDVVAWGAGAMVCTARIVTYLDTSPRGEREPEILDRGLGRCARVVLLPAAAARLQLGSPARNASIAQRFAPARCIAMEDNAQLVFEDERLQGAGGVFRLAANGKLPRVRAA